MSMSDADANDAAFGARIRSAVFWRSGSQIVAQSCSWIATLAVIRLLNPSDYGLFAMTQVILNFMAFLNGYGLISALVQSESLDSHRLRQAFGIMLLLNGGLALIQLALAPLVADYYAQPMVAQLLRVQALIYLSTPFISLPEALMGRSLDFRRPALVNLIAAVAASGTAIGCAIAGMGVWTLVLAPVVGFWVKAVGYVFATRFFLVPSFNFRGTGAMIGFGASLLGSQLFFIIQSQADVFIAGRVLDPHALGLYAEALFLTQIFVSKFIPPLNDVAFPAYARMQSDRERMNAAFCKAVRLILLIACPLYLGMAATAGPVVEVLFGQKWLPMAPYVSVLALAMPFMALQVLFGPALNAIGRPGLTARISALGALIFPIAFLVGIQFGPMGLAWAWLGAMPLLTLATALVGAGALGLRGTDLLKAVQPAATTAGLMALIVMGIDRLLPAMPAISRLALLASSGAACFGGLLWLFARPTVEELLALVIRRRAPAAAAE